MRIVLKICAGILYLILLISCVSQDASEVRERLKRLETMTSGENQYYFLQSGENSNSLIIYIEGSGLCSVLGAFSDSEIKYTTYAHFILSRFQYTDSVLIPEKPLMQRGGEYHKNAEVIRSYTVEGLVNAYRESIDSHLRENSYQKVTIIGASEGGILLPKLYNSLKYRSAIDSIVVIGAGGLNQYDCFKIQSESELELPEGYRAELQKLEVEYGRIIDEPNAINKWYLGWPYLRWNSFFSYTPLDSIKEIDIPMLYVQGNLDINSPVESVFAIENLGAENITIQYFPEMGHVPLSNEEQDSVFGLIDSWRNGL